MILSNCGRLLQLFVLFLSLSLHPCFVLDKLLQVFQLPASLVWLSSGALLGVKVHNRWESLHFHMGNFVFGAIHLGNDHLVTVLEQGTQFGVHWSQLLAVSTPRGVHLQKHKLLWVKDNLIKVLSDDHPHILLIWLRWNLCRLGHGISLSSNDVLSKLFQRRGRDLRSLWEGVLFATSSMEASHHGGLGCLVKSEKLQHGRGICRRNIRQHSDNLSSVTLGTLNRLDQLGSLLQVIGWSCNDNLMRNTASENALACLLAEHQVWWQLVFLEEGSNALLISRLHRSLL
mmetsp:Transcript_7404/g.14849  ORF Transcript_7404/g.14849 Transcript_7404/m.14849 type:complete len:287 (-) Transcript_7404:731-1591(-)